MDRDKNYIKILSILIKYKFANKGTAESTTNEILKLFKRTSHKQRSAK